MRRWRSPGAWRSARPSARPRPCGWRPNGTLYVTADAPAWSDASANRSASSDRASPIISAIGRRLSLGSIKDFPYEQILTRNNRYIVSDAVRRHSHRKIPRHAEGLPRARAGRHGGSRGGDARGHRSRDRRRVHHGQRRLGRRRPGAGAAGGAQGRPRGSRRRAHHQQGVRLGTEGRDARAAGHPDRRHRHRGRRRHGVDEQLPYIMPKVREGCAWATAGRRLDDSRRPLVPVREAGTWATPANASPTPTR